MVFDAGNGIRGEWAGFLQCRVSEVAGLLKLRAEGYEAVKHKVPLRRFAPVGMTSFIRKLDGSRQLDDFS